MANKQPEIKQGEPFIVCDNMVKIYKVSDLEVVALQGLDLTVNKGELIGIIGNSGSGKSTLMNVLGGLDRPSAGRCSVNGRDLLKMKESDMVRYRRDTVGFVWQNSGRNLIHYLTALENVELPMIIAGNTGRSSSAWAHELLDGVGLSGRKTHKLSALSGGEQQRVAIAIGLANKPPLLLADEPTGSVDTATAKMILEIFRHINRTYGTTIVIVTHDPRLASAVDRVVAIRDGRTSSEVVRRVITPARAAPLTEAAAAEHAGEPVQEQEQVEEEVVHEEFVVMDSAGRIQIPRDFVDKLSLKGRVVVDLEDDKVIVRPAPLVEAGAANGNGAVPSTPNGHKDGLLPATNEAMTAPGTQIFKKEKGGLFGRFRKKD